VISLNLVLAELRLGLKNLQVGEKWVSDDCSYLCMDASAAVAKEKCYGVVKAGQNDCATKPSSCAGSSNTDGQKDAFIINRNNHQKPTFHPLGDFFKPSLSPARTRLLTLASLTLLGSNFVVMDASAAVAKEKCYGVVKAGPTWRFF
jgi:uncharacterized membrane protein